MPKTVCIVQARLGSTRLPAKVLLPLPTGRTVLEEVISRTKKIEGVNEIVVAIPEGDTVLGEFLWYLCGKYLIRCTVGSEHDVLARYAKAAEEWNADIVVRITADCPLLNADLCSVMLSDFKSEGTLSFLSNAYPIREVPHGWDCEIFTRRLLDEAQHFAGDAEREHVTSYMKRTAERRSWRHQPDMSDKRWTLDTIDDYRRIWDLMKNDPRSDTLTA